MSTKETRTQYTLDQKRKYIAEAENLVAGGMQLKDAAKKLGINDAYIHTWKRTFKKKRIPLDEKRSQEISATVRNGIKIPSLEQKQKWVAQVDELRKTGSSVKEAIAKVGIRPDDYYRYKNQVP
jgi:transposase